MSVVQVNVWTCDFCGAVASTTEHTDVWSDPVVRYPEGWGFRSIPEAERKHPCLDCADACPECFGENHE